MKKIIIPVLIIIVITSTVVTLVFNTGSKINWYKGEFKDAVAKAQNENKFILLESDSKNSSSIFSLFKDQIRNNPGYSKFINENFVPVDAAIYRISLSDFDLFTKTNLLKNRFQLRYGRVVILKPDLTEFDRLGSTWNDKEKSEYFLNRLKNVINNVNLPAFYMSILESDPDNIDAYFQLALKYRFDHSDYETSAEMFKNIIERADEAKANSVKIYDEPSGEDINMLEYAEFLYESTRIRRRSDENKMMDFIKKYPDSRLINSAYEIAILEMRDYKRTPEMDKFIESALERFPEISKEEQLNEFIDIYPDNKMVDDVYKRAFENIGGQDKRIQPSVANLYLFQPNSKIRVRMEAVFNYLRYCRINKINIDKAIREFEKYHMNYRRWSSIMMYDYKELLKLNGNVERLDEIYGPEYMMQHISDRSELSSYARFWADEGRNLESALLAALKAFELKESYGSLSVLSSVYWKMGNYDKALENIDKAIEDFPGNSNLTRQKEEILNEMENKK